MTCEYSAGLPLGYLGDGFGPPYVASGPEAHPPSPPTEHVRNGSQPRDIRPPRSNSGVDGSVQFDRTNLRDIATRQIAHSLQTSKREAGYVVIEVTP